MGNSNIIMLWAGWPQSRLHIQALKKEGCGEKHRIVWCVNPDTALAWRFAEEYELGDIPVAWDMNALVSVLWATKDQITCIVNTPVNTHTTLLRQILTLHEQGKIVLAGAICEKLLGRNVTRATAITEAYEQQNIPLGVVCQLYFSSWVLLAQKLLSDVDVLNATFGTHFASADLAILWVEVHFEKNRTLRSLQASTNNLNQGNAPWTHFELPHMAAIVDALLGEIGELDSISGQDMVAGIQDVRTWWADEHPHCIHWGRVIIKNHAGWIATTLAWEKKVSLHSSLVSSARRREVIIRLANKSTLHIHLDPGETKYPESHLELKSSESSVLWKTAREVDNSLGICLRDMLHAITSWAPIRSNARRHIGLLQFLDNADRLLYVE